MQDRWEKWLSYEPKVRRYVARIMRDKAYVDDVVSEVMMRVVDSNRDFNCGYCFIIAKAVMGEGRIRIGRYLPEEFAPKPRAGEDECHVLATYPEYVSDELEKRINRERTLDKAEKSLEDFKAALDNQGRVLLGVLLRQVTLNQAAKTINISTTSTWKRAKTMKKKLSESLHIPVGRLESAMKTLKLQRDTTRDVPLTF